MWTRAASTPSMLPSVRSSSPERPATSCACSAAWLGTSWPRSAASRSPRVFARGSCSSAMVASARDESSRGTVTRKRPSTAGIGLLRGVDSCLIEGHDDAVRVAFVEARRDRHGAAARGRRAPSRRAAFIISAAKRPILVPLYTTRAAGQGCRRTVRRPSWFPAFRVECRGWPRRATRARACAAEERPTQHAPLELPVSATLRAAPAVGERIGKYVIERTIGHGGMGIVVAARHETLDETGRDQAAPSEGGQGRAPGRALRAGGARDRPDQERARRARPRCRRRRVDRRPVHRHGAPRGTRPRVRPLDLRPGAPDDGRRLHHSDLRGPSPPPMRSASFIAISSRRTSSSPSAPTARALVKVLDFGISKAAQSDGSPRPAAHRDAGGLRLADVHVPRADPQLEERRRAERRVVARRRALRAPHGQAAVHRRQRCRPACLGHRRRAVPAVARSSPGPAGARGGRPRVASRRTPRVASARRPSSRCASRRLLRPRARCSRLASSASRAGSRASQSIPPPPPSRGRSLRLRSRPRYGASWRRRSRSRPPSYPSAPAPAVAYGSTGTDLSATGPAAFRASVGAAPVAASRSSSARSRWSA